MSRGVNKVIIIGNLGQDPETRYSQSGTAFTNISVATSEQWTDKQTGQKQERTEWHKIVFMAKLAEIAGQYLRKGSKIYVEGRLQTRKWQDQSGQDRYTTEIVGRDMQMLDSAQNGQQPQGGYQQPQGQRPPPPPQNQLQGAYQAQPGNHQANYQKPQSNNHNDFSGDLPSNHIGHNNFDDDIPFANPYAGRLALCV